MSEPNDRELFARRLDELIAMAGMPLSAVATRAMERRGGARWKVTEQRISDWQQARHLPADDAAFGAVVRVLITLARARPRSAHGEVLDEARWAQWLALARRARSSAAPAWQGCPYPGLTAYTREHQDVFYGREQLSADLLAELGERLHAPGMLLLTGPSGAGKSSLLNAGLLPALARAGLPRGAGRMCEVLSPTSAPRDELARALAAMARTDPAVVRSLLEQDPGRAHVVVGDAILADAGRDDAAVGPPVLVVDSLEQERWVQSCRHELLDRCLVWNERHLRHALREYEHFYNQHRAHQGLNQAAPLRPVPDPITDLQRIIDLNVRRRDRLGGILHEYSDAA